MEVDKLARIAPAGIHPRPTDWDAYGPGRERREQRRRQPPPSEQLLELAAPGRDPATLDLVHHFDAAGALSEVVIRDRASGRVVRVLGPAEITRFSAEAMPGMLVERRG